MTKPAKQSKQTKVVSEKERLEAAQKIMKHVFEGGTIAQTLHVFHLIAEDAEESDLLTLTGELVAVRTGLGDKSTVEQVLGVHFSLVEDEDGMLLEDADEIDEQIEEARATLTDVFGEPAASDPENLAAFLGA